MPYESLSPDSVSDEYLDKVLVDIGIYTATRKDLECLLNSEMFLNDSLIQTSIKEREDGYAYLETTYIANMICGDTIASLRNKEEGNFRLYRTLTLSQPWYGTACILLQLYKVFFPINIKDCHWYLVVINGRKGVIQVLDSKGTATR
ncbi:hypothetical protein SETIT_2G150800v2 [Setaria italica]|uniref:Ubiquitin-like protease family profile domain-containing protein n=1 Tax=Setaria italica TaxID=4555 RepID=A0A368PYV5_SETIT|nr:hypothetical protein SETIT_2G150800v2 [Setaria italica]